MLLLTDPGAAEADAIVGFIVTMTINIGIGLSIPTMGGAMSAGVDVG